ncbi:MAG TPA: PPC domain-containing DNA-binding protein [Candidatus Aquilonibacter sp.]|nr:PPC domain-containing DNA-binding protein [Candidatus Aquilonibacter sp.]
MRFKRVADEPLTYAVIFETGDEIASGVKKFAKEQGLKGSSFKAIGACEYVKLGWIDWDEKKYKTAVELKEQVELLSMIGDVAVKDGEPEVHAHVVVGKRDGSAHGGHLLCPSERARWGPGGAGEADVRGDFDGEPGGAAEGDGPGGGDCAD